MVDTYHTDVVDRIILILKNTAGLAEPTNIKKYEFGPPTAVLEYPYSYVDWVEDRKVRLSPGAFRHTSRYIIAFYERDVDKDLAEKAVNKFSKATEEALWNNPTLKNPTDQTDPKVKETISTLIRKAPFPIVEADGQAVAGAAVMLETLWLE